MWLEFQKLHFKDRHSHSHSTLQFLYYSVAVTVIFFEDGWNWLPNPTNTRLNKQRSPRHVCGKTLKPSPLYQLL